MVKAAINYKETGVEWIPKIPIHWEMRRIKTLFSFRKEIVGEESTQYKVLSLTVQGDGIIERDIESGMGKFPATFDGYQKIEPNSIVLCLFDMDVTPRIVGFSELTGMISSAYTNIVPKEYIYPKFYYYYFLNQDRDKSLYALGKGIRITLREDSFGSLFAPYPSYDEQKAIVQYLDSQIEKINLFIKKKQRFIELLKEQRLSIVNNYVTTENKNWLWSRLKDIVTVNDEALTEKTDDDFLIRYIDIGNVNSYGDIAEIQEYEFKDAPSRARRIVRKGDIIISTVRTYLKAITLIESDEDNLIASTGFAVLRPKENVLSEYLNFALRAEYFISSVIQNSYGVSYPAINSSTLSSLKIVIPKSTSEQQKIINKIKSETATIDTAIVKAEREIELIREYKEAMIAEAVMGKLRN